MDKTLQQTLCDNGLSPKEAQIYITSLQLGQAPVSTIARHMKENRVTVYSILKNLITRGIAKSATKKNTTYYSMIEPEQLAKKAVEKAQRLESIIPQLMAMATKIDTPVKTQFFEGLEGLKTAYETVLTEGDASMEAGEPFLSFIGVGNIDESLQHYLEKEFTPTRLTYGRKTQAILGGGKSVYEHYTHNKHDTIVIDDPIFTLANEIVVYGKDSIAILMYDSSEMAALLVQSQTLHDALKAVFGLIRKLYHQPKKKK